MFFHTEKNRPPLEFLPAPQISFPHRGGRILISYQPLINPINSSISAGREKPYPTYYKIIFPVFFYKSFSRNIFAREASGQTSCFCGRDASSALTFYQIKNIYAGRAALKRGSPETCSPATFPALHWKFRISPPVLSPYSASGTREESALSRHF